MHVPPPLIAIAVGAAMKAAASATPELTTRVPGYPIITLLVVLVGLGIAGAGVVQFRMHRTTVNPLQPDKASTLVTSGVFRFTRNPMYLGMMCLLVAWAIWLGNLPALIVSSAFIPALNRLQILPEEQALERRFGEAFGEYANRTRRWL